MDDSTFDDFLTKRRAEQLRKIKEKQLGKDMNLVIEDDEFEWVHVVLPSVGKENDSTNSDKNIPSGQ